jgi:hypothetical protein
MNCWSCNGELIWNCDYDADEGSPYLIETVLTCRECDALVNVWHGKNEDYIED